MSSFKPSTFAPLTYIDDDTVRRADISLAVLRLDQLDPALSGNKYFKLKYNLAHAKQQGHDTVVSFGGAFSNHIHALALAGRRFQMATVGIIRGEPTQPLNPTLSDAVNAGMTLEFVFREQYRQRHDQSYQQRLAAQWGNAYVVPEGGSNALGVKGCREIIDHLAHHVGCDYDVIALACGTGATLAGLVAEAPADKVVTGFSVLKSAQGLEDDIRRYLLQSPAQALCRWSVNHDFHCGGYAKFNRELVQFVKDFSNNTAIPLDAVYTAKVFYGIYQQIIQRHYQAGTRIIVIHTGGLQGNRGIAQRWPGGFDHEYMLPDVDEHLAVC